MSWPLSQDYNEAIQSPRENFSDPDLQWGEAVANSLGIPLPCSGNFADVYQLRCPGGDRWAVKCFTREVPGLRERYAAISRHLAQAQLPFIVDFTFLEKGIRVRGQWFPVLKMQWVEGLTLNAFVRQYADKPPMLNSLLQIWVRMAARLRQADIAHADLQHGNVLLVPGIVANALALKLVDYDGMFVPALAGSDSGEVGHACYQHPQRLAERAYSLEVDRFPLLLIATALNCLKVGGKALWDKYDNGDNFLFREADLQSPVKSPLFYELLKVADPQAKRLVWEILDTLKRPLESAPLLEEVLPELHVPSASKPTMPAMPKRTPLIKAAAGQPVAEERPTVELVETSSASPLEFEGEDKPRSRWRRKGSRKRWFMGPVAVSVATLVLAGGIFALAPWNKRENPEDQARITENKSEHLPQRRDESPEKQPKPPDGHGQQKDDASSQLLAKREGSERKQASDSPTKKTAKGDYKVTPSQAAKRLAKDSLAPRVKLSVNTSIAELRLVLQNEVPALQEPAIARLAELGLEARPALHDLADTLTNARHATRIRTLAAVAIGKIGAAAKPVVPALANTLKKSEPLEVRQYSAESLALIGYPANEAAIPNILNAIENGADPVLRQKCIWTLNGMGKTDFKKSGADKLLAKVLDERSDNQLYTRYNAALTLARVLRGEAPDKSAAVLVHMLRNIKAPIFRGTNIKGKEGRSELQANVVGDARCSAVEALGWLGPKAQNPDVVIALREAAEDKDANLSNTAKKALEELKINNKGPTEKTASIEDRTHNSQKSEIEEQPEKAAESSSLRAKSAPLPDRKDAAWKAYQKSCDEERTRLRKAFDTVVEQLSKSPKQNQKLLDTVQEEKQRFENRDSIPWSQPMRRHVVVYLDHLQKAQTTLLRVYEPLIAKQQKAKNESKAAQLRAELKDRLDIREIARWQRSRDGIGIGIVRLFSNGKIDSADGNATWNYDKGVLYFKWPAPNGPGGAWINILKVDEFGMKYNGTNNDKPERRPSLTGVYVP